MLRKKLYLYKCKRGYFFLSKQSIFKVFDSEEIQWINWMLGINTLVQYGDLISQPFLHNMPYAIWVIKV